jgi:hypothetical protein
MSYFLIGIPLMHRRLLRDEMARGYLGDVLPPVLGAVLIAVVARILVPIPAGAFDTIGFVCVIGVATFGVAALLSSAGRNTVRDLVLRVAA